MFRLNILPLCSGCSYWRPPPDYPTTHIPISTHLYPDDDGSMFPESFASSYQTTRNHTTEEHNLKIWINRRNIQTFLSKVSPVRAMKANRGSRGTAPLIFTLTTRRWLVSVTFKLPYPQEKEPVPTKLEARWAPETVRTLRKRDNISCRSRVYSRACRGVAKPTQPLLVTQF